MTLLKIVKWIYVMTYGEISFSQEGAQCFQGSISVLNRRYLKCYIPRCGMAVSMTWANQPMIPFVLPAPEATERVFDEASTYVELPACT